MKRLPYEGVGLSFPEGKWEWHGGSGAMIWQLMFSGSESVMGIKRFPERRQATLFCLNSETGRVLCDDFVLTEAEGLTVPAGDGWMIGLETTYDGLLFCHTYLPGTPEHLGIWAVDLPGKVMVWSRPDLVFVANLGKEFLVCKIRVFAGFPERQYLLLDPCTGEEIEDGGIELECANRLRQEAESEQERQGIILPVSCMDEAGYAENIGHGAGMVTGRHRMRSEESGTVVWDSFLEIAAGEQIYYEDTMAAGLSAPTFSNFLIRAGRLYYIKEKEVLISVSLS
ncbi:MAG: hypothetical protein HGA97_02575 [Chlorobiaceae bacterium]|nr:hypothetical protein [Chlorobiaceae bacterium]